MWEIIQSETAGIWGDGPTPTNDDEFDAAVGYILGRALVGGEDCGAHVVMLGDRRTGSFLLPDSRELRSKWEYWLSEEPVTGGAKMVDVARRRRRMEHPPNDRADAARGGKRWGRQVTAREFRISAVIDDEW